MKRLVVVGAIALLSGCAASSPPPQPAAQRTMRSDLPRIVHRLVPAAPPGALGVIELRQERAVQDGTEVAVYRAYGGIAATDDVAQWRFAYTRTSLEGPGVNPGEWVAGMHAISVILTNITGGPIEIDWDRSAFVDAAGRRQRMIHRGVQLNQRNAPMMSSTIAAGATLNEFVFPADGITFTAPGRSSVWNAPVVFERLTPGAEFSIVLNIKSGTTTAPYTFRFSVVPPPAPVPPPAQAPAPTPAPAAKPPAPPPAAPK